MEFKRRFSILDRARLVYSTIGNNYLRESERISLFSSRGRELDLSVFDGSFIFVRWLAMTSDLETKRERCVYG